MLIYDIHWYPFDGAFSPLITNFKLIKRGYLKRKKIKKGYLNTYYKEKFNFGP